VDQHVVVRGQFSPHLADGLEERHALDVAYRAANFDKADIRRCLVRELLFCRLPDAGLDLVGDMGDDLDRLAKEVPAAFLLDDRAVHLPGRDIVGGRQLDIEETLVVAEIKVNLAPVLQDKNFAMLGRVHRTCIDIQVGVDFDRCYPVAAVFQDPSY